MSMTDGFLIEQSKPIVVQVPLNITGATIGGGTTGWIAMKFCRRLCFYIIGGAWAGGTPAVTLQQAKTVTGGSAKALAFTRVFDFSGATPADLPVVTTVVSNTYNLPNAANTLQALEVHAQDLDLANGFQFVQFNLASPGANTDLLAVLALAYDVPYTGNPTTLPSVLS